MLGASSVLSGLIYLSQDGPCDDFNGSTVFCTSNADQVQVAGIVGLYLNPPLNAVVPCVDEKPSIQALERKAGYFKTDNGKIVRAYTSTYKRHGTLSLFAALAVSTG